MRRCNIIDPILMLGEYVCVCVYLCISVFWVFVFLLCVYECMRARMMRVWVSLCRVSLFVYKYVCLCLSSLSLARSVIESLHASVCLRVCVCVCLYHHSLCMCMEVWICLYFCLSLFFPSFFISVLCCVFLCVCPECVFTKLCITTQPCSVIPIFQGYKMYPPYLSRISGVCVSVC